MNRKLIIFLSMIAFVFGFAVYEAIKLDKKLAVDAMQPTGTIIKYLPKDIQFYEMNDNSLFDINSLITSGIFPVVHFWGTYCGPCKVEFPELAELTQILKNEKKVKLLLIAVDDDLDAAKKFISKHNFSSENTVFLFDNKKEYNKLGTYKLPETFVIGAENRILKKFTGGQSWSQKYLVDYFKSL